ncbi:MAG TPA: hypothetical protein DCE23_01395 [Firmicutes bacterium]|nr:hypothetical protein [Bacillota bacterium]
MNAKKYVLLLFLLGIFMPYSAKALETENSATMNTDSYENTKYFKTVTLLNQYETLSNSLDSKQTFTTEISADEFYNDNVYEPQLSDNIIVSTKKLTVYLTKRSSSQYDYKAVAEWRKIPSIRTYETIGLGYYPSVKPLSVPDFEQYYCISGSGCYSQTAGWRTTTTSTGTAATFYLPSGDLTTLKHTFETTIIKTDPSSVIIRQEAVASYAEATEEITYNQSKSFTISTDGLIYSTTKYNVATVGVEWSGSW